jgi:hypothetical protein
MPLTPPAGRLLIAVADNIDHAIDDFIRRLVVSNITSRYARLLGGFWLLPTATCLFPEGARTGGNHHD